MGELMERLGPFLGWYWFTGGWIPSPGKEGWLQFPYWNWANFLKGPV